MTEAKNGTEQRPHHNSHRLRKLLVATTLLAAGCAKPQNSGEAEASVSVLDNKTVEAPSEHDQEGFLITFDRRGGGEPNINVYSDSSEDGRGTEVPGTGYYSGVSVVADCVEIDGREVNTHPEVGEAADSSDMWFRIQTGQDPDIPVQYATAVYTSAESRANIASRPIC